MVKPYQYQTNDKFSHDICSNLDPIHEGLTQSYKRLT